MAQHISIRVPWKDNGYNGLFCDKPCYNNSCLRLKNIAQNRKDDRESELAGQKMSGNIEALTCISEVGAFMSPDKYSKIIESPVTPPAAILCGPSSIFTHPAMSTMDNTM